MKRVIEKRGVEVHEQTPALRVRPGKEVVVVTENGEVRASTMVLATDGYSPLLGFFKSRIVPMCAYLIATAPLTDKQREAVGWSGKEKISDLNPIFDYFHPSADGRIIFGGAGLRYLFGGRMCMTTHQPSIDTLQKHLVMTFPQLEGIEVTHRWGGTLGMTFDFLPSVGMVEGHRNMLYAVGYSGEGVVLTQVAGKIISEMYSQEDNALTRLFFVNKPVPYALPEPLRYLAIWGFKQYVTHLRGRAIR
jgi:gamma-glutamylputrescine oxidase